MILPFCATSTDPLNFFCRKYWFAIESRRLVVDWLQAENARTIQMRKAKMRVIKIDCSAFDDSTINQVTSNYLGQGRFYNRYQDHSSSEIPAKKANAVLSDLKRIRIEHNIAARVANCCGVFCRHKNP